MRVREPPTLPISIEPAVKMEKLFSFPCESRCKGLMTCTSSVRLGATCCRCFQYKKPVAAHAKAHRVRGSTSFSIRTADNGLVTNTRRDTPSMFTFCEVSWPQEGRWEKEKLGESVSVTLEPSCWTWEQLSSPWEQLLASS